MQKNKRVHALGKKTLCLSLAALLCLGSIGCGKKADTADDGSKEPETTQEETVYTAVYDSSTIDSIPNYQFFRMNVALFFYAIGDSKVEVSLSLDDDKNYTLSSDVTNGTEDDDYYFKMTTVAKGTYTKDGDKISIDGAKSATYALTSNGTMEALMPFCSPTSAKGEWDTEDASIDEAIKGEILSYIPSTVFTVSGSDITSWENPNETGIVINDDDTVIEGDGGASLILRPDHTAVFATASQASTEGSWKIEGHDLTVTLSKIGPEMADSVDFAGEFDADDGTIGLEIDLSFTTSGQDVTILDFFEISEDVWSALQ